jgi:hypothetical protein
MTQGSAQHLGLRLPEAESSNNASRVPISPPATQGRAPPQPNAARPLPDIVGPANVPPQELQADSAVTIQQQNNEIQRLRALLAQASANDQIPCRPQPPVVDPPHPVAPHPADHPPADALELPQFFMDADTAARAHASAVSAVKPDSEAAKGVTLPAIVPGHKVSPLKLGE